MIIKNNTQALITISAKDKAHEKRFNCDHHVPKPWKLTRVETELFLFSSNQHFRKESDNMSSVKHVYLTHIVRDYIQEVAQGNELE